MTESYGAVAGFGAGQGAPKGANLLWVTSERTIIVPGLPGDDREAKDVTPQQLAEFAKRPGALVIRHGDLLKVKVKGNPKRGFALMIVAKDPAGSKRKIVGNLGPPPLMKDADNELRALGLAGVMGAIGPKVRETYAQFAGK